MLKTTPVDSDHLNEQRSYVTFCLVQQTFALPGVAELDRLNTEGEFVASVLTDIDGIPLVSAVTGERDLTEPLAAVVPLVRQSVQRSNEQVGLAEANEVVVNNSDGDRLVSRFFEVEGRSSILVCVVPVKRPYRKVMNKAVHGINRLWQQPSAPKRETYSSPAPDVVVVSDPQLAIKIQRDDVLLTGDLSETNSVNVIELTRQSGAPSCLVVRSGAKEAPLQFPRKPNSQFDQIASYSRYG